MTDQAQHLEGLKQIAPIWGVSIRHAQRLIRNYSIDVERIGERGHIRISYEKALEAMDIFCREKIPTSSTSPIGEAKKSYVYFISNGPEVKIGASVDPKERLRVAQTFSSKKVEIIHSFEGGKEEEKKIHEKFKEYHLSGEWFVFSSEIEAFIEVIKLAI